MARKRPATIAEYIAAAPREGQAHLRTLHAILEGVAPEAEQLIKWGTPFFVEPRFLFSYSAFKSHCNLAPSEETLEAFRAELKDYQTTKNFLQIPYTDSVPEDLVRRLAEHRLRTVRDRDDDSFW